MNNGQLLNNLLGISSANSAANKTSANSSARFESGEKFQQAFEQARPEVAARKPAARKNNPTEQVQDATRPAAKPVSPLRSQTDTVKPDSRPKGRLAESDTKDKSSVATPETSQPVSEEASAQVASLQEQPRLESTTDDAPVVSDPVFALLGQELLGTEKGLLAGDADLIPADDTVAESDLEAPLELDGSQLLPELGLTSLAPTVKADPVSTVSSPTLLSQVAALASGQALTSPSGLVSNDGDAVALDVTADGGELSADASGGDNPDFLLLNSKILLNKITEANMVASGQLDAAPLADSTKPAAVAGVESLLRLTDSQSPAARAFVVQTGVPVTVGSPQWTQAVGDKVLWLAAQNVSAAEIRLDPPELGPMQVKVSVNQDQASVTFTSPHPVVREVLDQQLNRLREMFSEQGLNLVNVDVSDKSFTQQGRDQQESAKNTNGEIEDENLEPVGISQAISMRLVDHYA